MKSAVAQKTLTEIIVGMENAIAHSTFPCSDDCILSTIRQKIDISGSAAPRDAPRAVRHAEYILSSTNAFDICS